MGEPITYGIEIPRRCRRLLDEHKAAVRRKKAEADELGSLFPTFVLSMAHPIILTSVERMVRAENEKDPFRIQAEEIERLDNPNQAAVRDFRNLNEFTKSPLYRPGAGGFGWRYVKKDAEGVLDLQRHDIGNYLRELEGSGAKDAARNMKPVALLFAVRNALAHGTYLYLAEGGEHAVSQPVTHFLFVGQNTGNEPDGKRFHSFLRIGVDDFADFLRVWVDWLETLNAAEHP